MDDALAVQHFHGTCYLLEKEPDGVFTKCPHSWEGRKKNNHRRKTYSASSLRSPEGRVSQQLNVICHFIPTYDVFSPHTISEWFLQATRESICIPSLFCGQGCFQPQVSHGELRPALGAECGLLTVSKSGIWWGLELPSARAARQIQTSTRQGCGCPWAMVSSSWIAKVRALSQRLGLKVELRGKAIRIRIYACRSH